MRLGEKIFVLRKGRGLSQEELANALRVSRQSVSNWETGAANPEISKLALLAETLGVSVDFLLDESKDVENLEQGADRGPHRSESERGGDQAGTEPGKEDAPHQTGQPGWLDDLPRFLKTGVYRYGWLYGLYLALSGLWIAIVGIIGRVLVRNFTVSLFSDSEIIMEPNNLPREVVKQITNELGSRAPEAPEASFMSILPNAILVIGVVIVVVGLVLAYVLKQWGKREER